MENPNILDLKYEIFRQIQNVLEVPGTMESFLEVLPPDCSSETILIAMELESKKYNVTPAKTLLTFLGSKGFRVSDLIEWFQAIGLEKALILLKKEEVLRIIEHPRKEVRVNQGGELLLTCTAVSYPPPEYQWFKDDVEILVQIDPVLLIKHARLEDSGIYTCLVTKWNARQNTYEWLYSEFANVEIIPSNLHAIPLPEVPKTFASDSARSLQMPELPMTAKQKYAFMVANDTYEHLENLQKPAADVKDIANMLSSLGFKIFAFRNLTLTEMRNAFNSYCEILIPGSYALFYFAGHGFELYGQTYLHPVDSTASQLPLESVCSEYILQCMQERKPAMNILLIDACRKLPPQLSENSESQFLVLPGRIFQAKMKNNTIYGYSTSFLCASHESDDESNSVFVKHLKKYITHDKSIQDVLKLVQNDFAKDPVARHVQFPVIKSTLAEERKLGDPVQDSCSPIVLPDIMDWCDIKRGVISKTFEMSQMKASIIIEFHHHMEIFCNGIDAYVYLYLKPDALMFILSDMEFNVTFISDDLNITPVHGAVLKDVNLVMGRRNLLFKKEILNVQKINVEELAGNISLKFCSKNVTKNIEFKSDVIKISELQLSVNHLASHNVEEPILCKKQISKNSFT